MKQILLTSVPVYYDVTCKICHACVPNFSIGIYTDTSNLQLAAVILQENYLMTFYSRNLNSTQRRYTTTEKVLLGIFETLKEFKTISLGYEIDIHTDH